MFELSVTVKNSEQKLTQKYLIYDQNVFISESDPTLLDCKQKAITAFGSEPEDIIMKIKLTFK